MPVPGKMLPKWVGAPLARFRRDRKASVALEFALLILPFAILLFAVLESCLSFTAQMVLANATDDLARRIRTGTERVTTKEQLTQAICNDLSIMVSATCPNLKIDFRFIANYVDGSRHTFDIAEDNKKNKIVQLYDNGAAVDSVYDTSNPRSRYILRVFYRWPVITDILRGKLSNFGDNSMVLSSSQVWRNEAF